MPDVFKTKVYSIENDLIHIWCELTLLELSYTTSVKHSTIEQKPYERIQVILTIYNLCYNGHLYSSIISVFRRVPDEEIGSILHILTKNSEKNASEF